MIKISLAYITDAAKLAVYSLLILLLLPCCALTSEFRKHLENGRSNLKYLQTAEDHKRLGFFSALFDIAKGREKPIGEIPITLHFIWIASKPFPESSKIYVKGWINRHPGWKVKFWAAWTMCAR